MEAIRIRLEDSPDYSIRYRVYVNRRGWTLWVENGEVAGTTGQARSLEAVQIQVVERGNWLSRNERDDRYGRNDGFGREGGFGTGDRDERYERAKLSYQTHVSEEGWLDWQNSGATSGVRGKQIEAIRIKLDGNPANIRYQVHLANKGWTSWIGNGDIAGTTGEARGIEAIRIKLEDAPDLSVTYRVNVRGLGWTHWERDGASAGTTGQARSIEAVQIELVDRRNGWDQNSEWDRQSDRDQVRRRQRDRF
jgi:uncharacterized protein YjdB